MLQGCHMLPWLKRVKLQPPLTALDSLPAQGDANKTNELYIRAEAFKKKHIMSHSIMCSQRASRTSHDYGHILQKHPPALYVSVWTDCVSATWKTPLGKFQVVGVYQHYQELKEPTGVAPPLVPPWPLLRG